MELSDFTWYAVRTNSRCERTAQQSIEALGYTVLYLHTSEWEDKDAKVSSLRPLRNSPWLPRYIFVGLTNQFVDGYPLVHEINHARGVEAMVIAPGGKPFPVPLSAMLLVTEKAELPSGMVWTRRPKPRLAGGKGYSVRLGNTTPYAGFIAAIAAVDLRGQIVVEIESFNRKVATTITLEDVDTLFDPTGREIPKVSVEQSEP